MLLVLPVLVLLLLVLELLLVLLLLELLVVPCVGSVKIQTLRRKGTNPSTPHATTTDATMTMNALLTDDAPPLVMMVEGPGVRGACFEGHGRAQGQKKRK